MCMDNATRSGNSASLLLLHQWGLSYTHMHTHTFVHFTSEEDGRENRFVCTTVRENERQGFVVCHCSLLACTNMSNEAMACLSKVTNMQLSCRDTVSCVSSHNALCCKRFQVDALQPYAINTVRCVH